MFFNVDGIVLGTFFLGLDLGLNLGFDHGLFAIINVLILETPESFLDINFEFSECLALE